MRHYLAFGWATGARTHSDAAGDRGRNAACNRWHRTGVIAAVYRMEYDHWTPDEAIRELKANGFGEFACSTDNDYIKQYILTYQRRPQSQRAARGLACHLEEEANDQAH